MYVHKKIAHSDEAHNYFTHQPAGDDNDDELLFRTKQTAMKYVSSILIVKVLVSDSRFRGRRERERDALTLYTRTPSIFTDECRSPCVANASGPAVAAVVSETLRRWSAMNTSCRTPWRVLRRPSACRGSWGVSPAYSSEYTSESTRRHGVRL